MGKENSDIEELERLFTEDAYSQVVGGMDVRTLTPRPISGPPQGHLTKETTVQLPPKPYGELGSLAYSRASEYSQIEANKLAY